MMTVVESALQGADRRSERRSRTLKAAKIVFNLGQSVFDCKVRNLSPSGALIEVPSMVGVPMHFQIIMAGSSARQTCSVQWHSGRMIGVRFESAAPKAA